MLIYALRNFESVVSKNACRNFESAVFENRRRNFESAVYDFGILSYTICILSSTRGVVPAGIRIWVVPGSSGVGV